MSVTPLQVRFVDRRGQRFGAGFSAITLLVSVVTGFVPIVALVAVAVGVSAAFGTRWFLFGRPWLLIRWFAGGPGEREPEVPPRFAQALGAVALSFALLAFAAGFGLAGWFFVLAVAGLQTVLAVTGFCLGCRLYGLHWMLPTLFDRAIGAVRGPIRG